MTTPKGIRLFYHDFAAIFPISCDPERERLYCAATSMPVPFSSEIIVEHGPASNFVAECFAATLRGRGYQRVTIEAAEVRHELGEAVA